MLIINNELDSHVVDQLAKLLLGVLHILDVRNQYRFLYFASQLLVHVKSHPIVHLSISKLPFFGFDCVPIVDTTAIT